LLSNLLKKLEILDHCQMWILNLLR